MQSVALQPGSPALYCILLRDVVIGLIQDHPLSCRSQPAGHVIMLGQILNDLHLFPLNPVCRGAETGGLHELQRQRGPMQ
ncbi:hypothetical protein D3C84_987880 [compost metagenome]